MNIFIYPDVFITFDNGTTISGANEFEDCGLITSSFDPSLDPYDNFGLISVTSTPATEQITLDSNPPAILNYTTRNVDSSEDYGSLRYGLRDSFSIENYGLIISSVDERESYDLISTPVYSYGTTSKTITYGLDSILYLESPESFGLITENPYIQYGLLTDSVTYTDYGSVSDSLPANQYTDYGNNNLLASDEDYGLVITPYDQYTDYHFVFYSETVYPYGSFSVSGTAAESFDPATAVGSGSIAADGVKGEAITDSYNINSTLIDTSIESSINYGIVSASVDESEDYGLITSSVDEVDSYGFLYPVITPFGLFNISGSASDIIFKQSFVGSGFVQNTGVLQEKNTDRYSIDSTLPGGSPEDYGSIGSSAISSESYGLITASIDQVEDYHYIFYPAGETILPYGTIRISGDSFNELRIQFIFEGSGSIAADGVKGEAITDSYNVDSVLIDISLEATVDHGSVGSVATETEDCGLIIASVDEVDSYGFLYPVITPFGLFDISGSASESFKPASYIGSGSITNDGILEEKNTDSYNLGSILPGGSPEDYGSVGSSATSSESYGLITSPIDQTEDYHYIFYPAGVTILPYGAIQISGASFDELRIQFIFDGSGSISASGVKGEAITDSYNVDSVLIDTSIEFSTSYGSIADVVTETEDFGLIIDSVTEVDSYGFLYPVITPFGLFNISGSAIEKFNPTSFIGSGSITNDGILEEKNTDRYTIDSILPGGSPEDYGAVNTSATSNESYGLITAPIDQVENYDYIFYTAGETILPYGTIRISGDSFNELRIQFIHEGSGSIAANGVVGEAITKFYSVDSIAVDTSIEFSTSYGSIVDVVTETEDYGLIIDSVTEVDSYGFLYPVITPFGLFEISGSARESFNPSSYIASGSITNDGILEEKNTDRYTIDSILPGGSPEDYGTVNTSATSNESYGLITDSVDQAENYDYIFYTAGETVYPYGTIQISGASFDELRIQFIFDGSGSISASGVKGEAITDSYNVDSIAVDTSIEFSTSYGSIAGVVTESEDYGLITASVDEVDSYGFLYPVITPFGLFDISGSASESFKPASYIGSGSIIETGILEEKNTDSYNIDSILPGGSPEDYGSVGSSATSNESYGLITAPIDQVENYDYIFYTAGETVYPFGTISVSGDAFSELRIQFIHEGSGSIAANGVVGEAITKFYSVDSIADDPSIEFSTSYGLVSDSADQFEDYGLITASVDEVDSYGFLYPVITPFGLFEISGSASESFKPASYIGSGSVTNDGILEEKNTDSYNLGSILPGGSPEDYGTVNTSATSNESYGLITAPIDQVENYDYIFYTAGETVYPYGTIQISGDAITELGIQFVHEGSGSIAANGVVGEAITKFYSIDSLAVDTSIEFSTSYGSIAASVDETDNYGLIIDSVTEVDSYGFLYPVITPFGLFEISGSASESFKPASYIGSGSITNDGILEEKNTDSYNLGSILPGGSPEDYGSVGSSATSNESYGLITAPIDQSEDYHYIFYPAGETVYPYGTIQISGDAFTELRIQFIHEGSGTLFAIGGAAEVSGSNPPDQITPIVISGTVFARNTFSEIGSGSFSSFGGAAEVSGSNPPDRIVPIEISGTAEESFIPASYNGSGSIAANGIVGEAITKFYSVDSILIDTSLESTIDYGSVTSVVTETEDYGLITASVDEVDSYGFLYPVITPFGLFNISGSASESFNPAFAGSGSVTNDGVLEEKNTDRYTIDSILPGGSPEDYGSVGSSATSNESYELIFNPVDQSEDYHYIFYTAGETVYPFGTIQISGGSFDELRIQFIFDGSGSIAANGIVGEAITKFYSVDSIAVDTSIEFSTSYGSITTSVDETEDYGLITTSVDEVDSYGFLYPVITPFGLFNISGSASESFKPASYIGSGSVVETGVLEEKNTDSYNIDSILPGGAPEDYGTVNTSATSNDPYGLITAPIDQSEDYHYIFYPAGETVYPYGTIQISGDADKEQGFAYEGSGNINIIGYALVPQRFEGSGTFSSFGGGAEVSGSNPPDQIVPIEISGAATQRLQITEIGSGTFSAFGGSAEVSGSNPPDREVIITISGTVGERFTPATAIGSGTILESGVATDLETYVEVGIGTIVIAGAITPDVQIYVPYWTGSGTGVFSGDAGTEVRGKPEWRGSGEFEISGTAAESFTPATAIGSGTFSSFGGGAEVSGSNPPDQTVAIEISGAATDLKNTYSNVGSGTIVVSGAITPDVQIYVPSWTGSGTATFSGTAAESFTPATAIGSGTFSSFGGGAEVSGSNPPDRIVPIEISGASTNKNTYSNVGSGTATFSGASTNKNTYSNVGSGTATFSGTVGERFTPATAIGSGTFSSFGGGAEVSGSNPPDQTVTITISGDSVQKRKISEVGSGTFSSFGGGAEVSGSNPPDQTVTITISGAATNLKNTYSNVGSGTFSSFGGGAEVKGSNPPDQTVIINISGNAGERFTPAVAIGSGSISESGEATDLKNTRSEVGIGTVAISGGITPDVQIYVPSWTGSGTLFGIGGAAEVSGSNPPDRFVLFTLSGTAAESFTPTTAIGSGVIEISGVGVGVSNPYRAPFVYVTII